MNTTTTTNHQGATTMSNPTQICVWPTVDDSNFPNVEAIRGALEAAGLPILEWDGDVDEAPIVDIDDDLAAELVAVGEFEIEVEFDGLAHTISAEMP